MEHRDRPRKPWVHGEVAAQRIVDATIELLRERPFSEVTTREIADRADLYKQLIPRHFGSLNGLFIAVIHELLVRGFAGFDGTQRSTDANRADLELRSRLIAWLVTSGVEPLSIVPEEDHLLFRGLMRSRVPGLGEEVSERAALALSSIVGLLSHASAVFASTIPGVTAQHVSDVQLLIVYLRQHLADAEKLYGWAEPEPAAGKPSRPKGTARKPR
jgi:AcrR family transcriptional regulator